MHTGTKYRLLCDSHAQPGTVLLAVTDDAGRAVGTASMITGETWQLIAFDAPPSFDATVAAALCHGIVQTLRVNRVHDLVISPDGTARAWLASFGLLPSTTSVSALLDRQRRTNPEAYRLISHGYGLAGIELPHPAELLTAPADAGRALAQSA